jgi:hypothetical protein
MATQRYYSKILSAIGGDFLPQLARFLVNDHATETGPTSNWTVIDTYSSAAGTPHQIPGVANDLDSLNADNGWRTNTIAVSDYIILQSGNAGNKMQLGIEYQSTTLINFIVAPLGGFVTGFDNADMTVAGNWANPKCTTFPFTFFNAPGDYSIVAADAGGNFKLLADNGTTRTWTYIGNLVENVSSGDANPFVSFTSETNVFMGNGTGIAAAGWSRISAVDDTTELTNLAGTCLAYTTPTWSFITGNILKDSDGGAGYFIAPVGIISPTTGGHLGFQGMLDGVWVLDQSATGLGAHTLASKAYLAVKSSATMGAIVIQWDGITAY